MLSIEEIDKKIERQRKEVEQYRKDTDHKLYTGDSPYRVLQRLLAEKQLILSGVQWKHSSQGLVIIEDKYVYALITGKWRTVGKTKWYWSKSLPHFIENYVKKQKENK